MGFFFPKFARLEANNNKICIVDLLHLQFIADKKFRDERVPLVQYFKVISNLQNPTACINKNI